MKRTQDKASRKRHEIITAAAYRFSHFGMEKTTMAEIASDLSISKASLYYYFPDKTSLFAAVLDYVIEEVYQETMARLKNEKTDPYTAMEFVLQKRMDFVAQYFKFLVGLMSFGVDFPKEVEITLEEGQKKELHIIEYVLESGVNSGVLTVEHLAETVRIFHYAIMGMRFSVLNTSKIRFFPSKQEFEQILLMQKKLIVILLNGLSKN